MAGSTPIYGFPYPQSTDLVADYPTLGQELATDVETVISGLGSGLNIISATSIANSGGTATRTNGQVVFSGVTSISLNGIFTSTYENYRVELNTTAGSGANNHFRLRVAGTDSTANYDYWVFSRHSGGGGSDVGATGANGGYLGITSTSGATAGISLDILRPAIAQFTCINTQVTQAESSLTWTYTGSNGHRVSTAYDGLTFYPASGSITGSIRVYGYKNS